MEVTKDKIDLLAEALLEHGLTEMEYEDDKFRLRISKASVQVNGNLNINDSVLQDNDSKPEQLKKPDNKSDDHNIKSPIVGHFYASRSPLDPPLIKVGDTIKKGDVICIIEAMKVMNEVKSDVSGQVVNIFVDNGDFVDYDLPLVAVKVNE